MRYVILFLIGLTVETLPALADNSDDWPDCGNSEGNSVIAACTRILQRWEDSGSDLFPPPSDPAAASLFDNTVMPDHAPCRLTTSRSGLIRTLAAAHLQSRLRLLCQGLVATALRNAPRPFAYPIRGATFNHSGKALLQRNSRASISIKVTSPCPTMPFTARHQGTATPNAATNKRGRSAVPQGSQTTWNATHDQQEPFTYGALPAEALYFKTAAN